MEILIFINYNINLYYYKYYLIIVRKILYSPKSQKTDNQKF